MSSEHVFLAINPDGGPRYICGHCGKYYDAVDAEYNVNRLLDIGYIFNAEHKPRPPHPDVPSVDEIRQIPVRRVAQEADNE